MKTAQDDFAAVLGRARGRSLGDISKADAAKVVRRIASTDQDAAPTLDVAAFGSSI